MDRGYMVRFSIETSLKDILKCAKRGNTYLAIIYKENLIGALSYMISVGDITEETYKRVMALMRTITHKYKIY